MLAAVERVLVRWRISPLDSVSILGMERSSDMVGCVIVCCELVISGVSFCGNGNAGAVEYRCV